MIATMDVERVRAFLLTLPYVAETLQWGDNLVFWVGQKQVGGKMFVLMDLEQHHGLVLSCAATPERAAEWLERDGFQPAPYLARAHWVAVARWDVMGDAEWRQLLRDAHSRVFDRLPAKVRKSLEERRQPAR